MDKQENQSSNVTPGSDPAVEESRRNFLRTAGRFAIYTPPAVMLLMKPSYASVNGSAVGRPKNNCNNGLGNGLDCQPPGNPPINDGAGTSPGNPGNKHR